MNESRSAKPIPQHPPELEPQKTAVFFLEYFFEIYKYYVYNKLVLRKKEKDL